jgi:hypothetical protein
LFLKGIGTNTAIRYGFPLKWIEWLEQEYSGIEEEEENLIYETTERYNKKEIETDEYDNLCEGIAFETLEIKKKA